MGFDSDGASVMTGVRSGVSTRLKADNPYIVNIHCVARRLTLAAAQGSDKVPYLKNNFNNTLKNLFYFYENSSVRLSGLHAIQAVLDNPEIKLKKPLYVRWLSYNSACQALRSILPSVLVSLSREASEHGEPVAAGLLNMITQFKFIATLLLLCDILPHLNRLSCMFQSADLDLSLIQSQILATLEKLRQLRDTPGDYLKSLDSILKTTLKDWNINMSEAALVSFKCNIQKVYVDVLLENITNRFPDAGIISAFSIFDPLKLPVSEERAQQERYGESSLNTLVELYGSGTSPIVSSVDAKNEWEVFVIYMIQNCKSFKMKDVLVLLASNDTLKTMYPNLAILASICLVLPVSTVDCERGFSTMKRIKTLLRSVMKTQTLDCLM